MERARLAAIPGLERPFLGPLYDAWSSAVQGKPGAMKLPVMLRVLMSWLADRPENGGRLQESDCCVGASCYVGCC